MSGNQSVDTLNSSDVLSACESTQHVPNKPVDASVQGTVGVPMNADGETVQGSNKTPLVVDSCSDGDEAPTDVLEHDASQAEQGEGEGEDEVDVESIDETLRYAVATSTLVDAYGGIPGTLSSDPRRWEAVVQASKAASRARGDVPLAAAYYAAASKCVLCLSDAVDGQPPTLVIREGNDKNAAPLCTMSSRTTVMAGILEYGPGTHVLYFETCNAATGAHVPVTFSVTPDTYGLVPDRVRRQMEFDATEEIRACIAAEIAGRNNDACEQSEHSSDAGISTRVSKAKKAKKRSKEDEDEAGDSVEKRVQEYVNDRVQEHVVRVAQLVLVAFFDEMCDAAHIRTIGDIVAIPRQLALLGGAGYIMSGVTALAQRKTITRPDMGIFPHQNGFYVGSTKNPPTDGQFCAMVPTKDIASIWWPSTTRAAKRGTKKTKAGAAGAASAAPAGTDAPGLSGMAANDEADDEDGGECDDGHGTAALMRQLSKKPVVSRKYMARYDEDDEDAGPVDDTSAPEQSAALFFAYDERELATRSRHPNGQDRVLSLQLASAGDAAVLIGLLWKCTIVQSRRDAPFFVRELVRACVGDDAATKSPPLAGITNDTIAAAIAVSTFDRTNAEVKPAYPVAAKATSMTAAQYDCVIKVVDLARMTPFCANAFACSADPDDEGKIMYVDGATCKAAVAKRGANPTSFDVRDLWVDSETYTKDKTAAGSDDESDSDTSSDSLFIKPDDEEASAPSCLDDSLEFEYSDTESSNSHSSAEERKLKAKLEAVAKKRAAKRKRQEDGDGDDTAKRPAKQQKPAESKDAVRGGNNDVEDLFGDM